MREQCYLDLKVMYKYTKVDVDIADIQDPNTTLIFIIVIVDKEERDKEVGN